MASRRDYDDDIDDVVDDDYRDRPSRRGRRGADRPGKVQAIAIMTLVGGIIATLNALAILAYFGMTAVMTLGLGLLCCLWPGPYYGLVIGILAIIKGSQLMGQDARSLPPPKGIAIMMIVNIVNFDVVNCTLGIIILVFCGDPEVEEFFRG
jgi:hypothetical protein